MISTLEQQRRDEAHRALVLSIDAIKEEQILIRQEQSEFRAELKKNSEMTADNAESTKEMVEIFGTAKGGFKVLGWIGTGIKWLGGISIAMAGMYAFFYALWHGIPPK